MEKNPGDECLDALDTFCEVVTNVITSGPYPLSSQQTKQLLTAQASLKAATAEVRRLMDQPGDDELNPPLATDQADDASDAPAAARTPSSRRSRAAAPATAAPPAPAPAAAPGPADQLFVLEGDGPGEIAAADAPSEAQPEA